MVLKTFSSIVLCLVVVSCARLPALTLSPELLKDPIFYQVLGEQRHSMRDMGNELRRTVVISHLKQMMQPIAYNSSYSEHILVISDRQEIQVNRDSDTLLVAIEGHGYMEGVNKTAVVWENEIIKIPKNTPHAFINAATQPTVLYAVFSPPYDDRRVFAVKTKRSTFYIDDSTPIGMPQK